MSYGKILLLVVVLTIAMFVYQYLRSNSEEIAAETVVPAVSAVEKVPLNIPQVELASEAAPTATADEPGCLTLKQFGEHPQLLQDMYRLGSVSAGGANIDAYRGVDDASLRSYAEQGDGAAMAVVGAKAVMRAFDKDESRAIELLSGGFHVEELTLQLGSVPPDVGMELNDAAYWFYQAALHGRLFALQHYGSVRSKLFGGPVGLGWISQEAYDALGAKERMALVPANLYLQVAYDLAPQLREGFLGGLADSVPVSDAQLDIRMEQVRVFETSLAESELPPINVAATATSESDEMFAQICASAKRAP